jgi:hypothetical protein
VASKVRDEASSQHVVEESTKKTPSAPGRLLV